MLDVRLGSTPISYSTYYMNMMMITNSVLSYFVIVGFTLDSQLYLL